MIKPGFSKSIKLLPRGCYLSSACCLQTGPLWMMSCAGPVLICCSCCCSFRSLNLACFTSTLLSWLRAVLLLELTAQFCFFSSLISKVDWTGMAWLASPCLCINVKSASLKSLSRSMSLLVVVCLLPGLHLNCCVSHVQRGRCVCVDVPIYENVSAALLHKGSLPLNNAVPLL